MLGWRVFLSDEPNTVIGYSSSNFVAQAFKAHQTSLGVFAQARR